MLKMLRIGKGKTVEVKRGQDKISGAIAMFTDALEDLNAGIQMSDQEIAETKDEIEAKRKAFEEEKAKLEAEIASNKEAMQKAETIKANIQNLLGA